MYVKFYLHNGDCEVAIVLNRESFNVKYLSAFSFRYLEAKMFLFSSLN